MGKAETLVRRVSRVVERQTEVETQGGNGYVEADTQADTDSDIAKEPIQLDFTARILFGGIEEPHITNIGKEGTLKDAEKGEAFFEIEDKLEIADAFKQIVTPLETSRSEVSQLPGTHGGWTPAEETLLVRHGQRITVGNADTQKGTDYEGAGGAVVKISAVFAKETDILRIRNAEYLPHAVAVGRTDR